MHGNCAQIHSSIQIWSCCLQARAQMMVALVVTSISKTANSQNLTFFAGIQLLPWGIAHSTYLRYCMVKSCWPVHGVWWFQQSPSVLQGMSLYYITCSNEILKLVIDVRLSVVHQMLWLILMNLLVMFRFSLLNDVYP